MNGFYLKDEGKFMYREEKSLFLQDFYPITENPDLDSSYRDTDLKKTGENDSVEDLNRSNILLNNLFGY
jgi:hypothetical protein